MFLKIFSETFLVAQQMFPGAANGKTHASTTMFHRLQGPGFR